MTRIFLLRGVVLGWVGSWGIASGAIAQITPTPDDNLGAERSVVTPNAVRQGLPATLIQGGALRGPNLFQSFSDFNVGNGQQVYFANPGVQNILARVTGGNPSNILGTLGVDGSANLFLMNPRGILFGENARLDISGSFTATTAEALTFGASGNFSATSPSPSDLLVVGVEPGFQYGTGGGNIALKGDLALNTTGQGFVARSAGDLSLTGKITTQGGNVNLSAKGQIQVGNGRIDVCPAASCDLNSFDGSPVITLVGDKGVTVNSSSLVNRGDGDVNPGSSAGAIGILSTEGSVLLDRVEISTTNVGNGNAGLVFVTARDRVEIANSQGDATIQGKDIKLGVFSRGNNGGVIIGGTDLLPIFPTPREITINNSEISVSNDTSASGQVDAGSVSVNAIDSIIVSGDSDISTSTFRQGNAGDVSFQTQNGAITIDNSNIFSNISRGGQGAGGAPAKGGDIGFVTGTLKLVNNAEIQTSVIGVDPKNPGSAVGIGNAGTVSVSATGDVSLSGDSDIFTDVERGAIGNAGRVIIATKGDVYLSDKSSLVSNVQAGGQGNAGGVGIAAANLSMIGESSITTSTAAKSAATRFDPNAVSSYQGSGSSAGAVVLFIDNKIQLDNSTIFNNLERGGEGSAGFILMTAKSVTLASGAQIQTLVRGAKITNGVIVQPGADGDAGAIFILADDRVDLIGRSTVPSAIFSSVGEGATGNAGGVYIGSPKTIVREGASISVSNFSARPGDLAGDIVILSDRLDSAVWVTKGGVINASTNSGAGGNIIFNIPGAVVLTAGGSIFALAGIEGGGGDGGSIRIGSGSLFDSRTLLIGSAPSNDINITAKAFNGLGGNIRLSTVSLLDLQKRPLRQRSNDIDASGIGETGTVSIRGSLNVDPSQGSNAPPPTIDNPRISEGCDPRVKQETSKVIVIGQGGMPIDYSNQLVAGAFSFPSQQADRTLSITFQVPATCAAK
jgi:filamentous hemagglutinin family protein